MKATSLIALLALSLGAAACVGDPGEGDDLAGDTGEETGETNDPLTVAVSMGGLGWVSQTPVTTDLVLAHRVTNIYNKWAEVASIADFPSLEGLPATQANVAACKASTMDVYVYKRGNAASPWTQIDQQKRFAKATVSNGVISSCEVTFDTAACDPYDFGSFDAEMEVDLIAIGGDAAKGRKSNVVRYPKINLASCD